MQNNQKISIPLINNSAQRNKSAKVQRHDQSREKFKGYINKQTKDDKKRDQLQGKKQQDLIPTPGQFLVVSNQQHTRSQQVASRQQRSMTGKSISNMGITQQVPVTNKSIVMNASQVRSNVGTGRQNTRLRSSNSVMSNTSLMRNVGSHLPNANQNRQQEQNGSYINLSKITGRNNNSKNGQFSQQNQIKNDNFYEDHLLQQSEQLDASQYALKSNAQPYITTNLKQIINRQHTGLLEKSSKTIQQLIDENVLQEGTTLKRSAVNNERMKKAQIQPLNESKNSSFMQKSGSNRGLRPISASYLKNQIQKEQNEVSETSEYLKQVINEDRLQNNQKIKTSYIVSRKSLLKNKYIQGYQTVKLTQNDLRNFMKNQQNFQKIDGNQSRIDYSRQSPYIYNDDNAEREIAKRLNLPTKESHNKNQDEERKKGYFLPLDYYNLDDEDGHPEIVMEKYRDPNSGELFGYSKWQLNNGSFEWRRCRVLNYNEQQERYMVQWQNGKTKFVSRINLRFEREHEDEFQKKLKAAEYYREMSEMFMKYNFMIESLECNANLPENVVENIIIYVAGFTIKLGPPADPIIHEQLSAEEKFNYRKKQFKEYEKKELNGDNGKARQLIEKNYSDKVFQELLKEINKEFRNGNKRVQFNSSLPFSEERQKLFMGILPDYMFISPVLQGTIETNRTRKSEMGVPDQYYIRYLVLDEKRNQEEVVEKYNFLSYFEKIREDLNRANQDILKRLSDIHLDSILFQSRFLVPENLQEFESVLEFKKIFSNKALEGQRYLGSKIFDHNFDISEIVGLEIKRVTDKNAEIERRYGDAKQREKRAIQMSSQFKTQILRLQRSINYQYEMIGRKQFIDSMELYFSYFNSIMNLYRNRNQENINNLEIDQSIAEVIDEEKLINFIESQKFLSYSSSFKQIKLPFKNILTCKNKLVRNDPEFMIKQAKEQILKNRQLEREKIINEKKEKIEKGELQMDEKTFLEQQALLRKDEDEEILDKDIKIRKFKNNNYVQYDIDLDEWIQEFENVFENVVYLFKTIQCMGINHFEPVRKNNLLKIFENVNLKMVKDEIYVLNEGKAQNESDDDQIIVEYRKRIKGVIGQMRQIGQLYLNRLENYFGFLGKSEHMKKKMANAKFKDIENRLIMLKKAQEQIPKCLFNIQGDQKKADYNKIRVGFMVIDIGEFKQFVEDRIQKDIKILYELLMQKIDQKHIQYEQEIDHLSKKIQDMPQNIEQMDQMRKYCQGEFLNKVQHMKDKIQVLFDTMNYCKYFNFQVKYDNFKKLWQLFSLPGVLLEDRDEYLKQLNNLQKKLAEKLKENKELMLDNIKTLKQESEELFMSTDIHDLDAIHLKYDTMDQQINQMLAECKQINSRESILRWEQTDFSKLNENYNKFQPYHKVWILAKEYSTKIPNIMSGPLPAINRDDLTKDIQESWETLYKLERNEFKSEIHMKRLTQTVRLQYESFKPYLPLINDLRNPCMEKANWRALNKVIQDHNKNHDIKKHIPIFEEDFQISLDFLLNNNIMLIQDDIREISEISTKERGFEKILYKMKMDWKPIKLTLTDYKDSGSYIIKSIDPIIDKLDEDIAKILSIASSPFVKFMEQEVNKWRQQLQQMQEHLELWIKAQKLWQYLQPIFSSEDIYKELPKEGAKFQQADKQWNQIIGSAKQTPNCMDACFQIRLKEILIFIIDTLEHVVKGLNQFLNKKRLAFPRFFFLSNDELISILSQTKDVRQVQNHLPKCFEGIDKLTFQEDNMITHFNSAEGEQIKFLTATNPIFKETKGGEKEGKYVEEWLAEIENGMKSTLLSILQECIREGAAEERKKWLLKWPSQIVIATDSCFWTGDVTEAIYQAREDQKSLQKCYDKKYSELLEIVEMVRGDVSKIDRITLGCLVTLEVHANNVIQELIDQNVNDDQEFEWLSQLRYYLVDGKKNTKEFQAKMVSTTRVYGFEYLGNQGRLVITPLTDRCYRTLMSALQLNLGGAPEGPAGTGKTETTKDLAKAIGKHCVVFNCSDALDFVAMGKFFKGLCCCGSWACFDEFNRIDLETLSVIASQILTIQNNIMKQKVPGQRFLFEGDDIPLDPSCAVFITMNPGYAGRSELPDNLKALFRPVAMMIPNYAMISEISLYSFGFVQARDLSIKITTSLKLASEQLSTQSHYDYGMRAVKSIITAAGSYKRQYPEENESLLVLKAISDCNLPKFTSKDVPLFEAIINDLFPNEQNKEQVYEDLDRAFAQICENEKLVLKDRFRKKIYELYETIQVRHGLMLVGQTNSGKSSVLNTLQKGIELRNFQDAWNLISPELREELEEEYLPAVEEEMSPVKKRFYMGASPVKQSQPDLNQPTPAEMRAQQVEDMKYSIFKSNKHVLEYDRVVRYECNPKAISIQLLFGDVDQASGDWIDGVTALLFRECQQAKNEDLKWVVFDGPVDALWIENMNTVLDDNKKLCLANGETIKMVQGMNIIFEVEDLLEASPATVSRCGMVFMENKDLGFEVFYEKWFSQLADNMNGEEYIKYYQQLFETYLNDVFGFVEEIQKSIKIDKMWLASNFLKIFECFLLKNQKKSEVVQKLAHEKEKMEAKLKAARMQGNVNLKDQKGDVMNERTRGRIFASFLMALTWSCGCVLETIDDRQKFNVKLKQLVDEKLDMSLISKVSNPVADDQQVDFFNINFDFDNYTWNQWMKTKNFKISEEIQFHEIFIPTNDSVRHKHMIKVLVQNQFAGLFYGKTGTGKTQICKDYLMHNGDTSQIVTITSFSANTSASGVQDVLESKLEKQKRRKGVLGPLIGHANIIFVDDLNMPNKEKYGSQPALELIRQWFSQGGWYERKSLEFNKIIDIQFFAAMGVGRPSLSQRLMRHFNLIYLQDLSDQTLGFMISKIFEWGMKEYPTSLQRFIEKMEGPTIQVYQRVQREFLPLPSKSHYIFNLRDLMKVIQGLLSVSCEQYPLSDPYQINPVRFQRLWIHEQQCIYNDRLINQQDKERFQRILDEVLQQNLGTSLQGVIEADVSLEGEDGNSDGENGENSKKNIDQNDSLQEELQDFIQPKDKSQQLMFGNFTNEDRLYKEIRSMKKIRDVLKECIENYNSVNKKKIDIILFEDALSMFCKINRIISQPFGNALLIGLGGSGSHTQTRLATFIQAYKIYELEIDKDFNIGNWYEFLRDMLRDIVTKNETGVFLISDGQILQEQFLEDINNLLNIGEIPNLFTGDDKESLLDDIKEVTQKQKMNLNYLQCWQYFVNQCKTRLHIVMCLSPIGGKLRQRIRNFPSLVSCTSPIWVQSWSETALNDVCYQSLQKCKENINLEDGKIRKISQIFVGMHKSVQNRLEEYFNVTGNYFYVTETIYLKLLKMFEKVYDQKVGQVNNRILKYTNGIQKLNDCQEVINQLKYELEMLQPVLKKKTEEIEQMKNDIKIQQEEAETQRVQIMEEERQTAQKAKKAEEIKAECAVRLSTAEPKLKEAIDALKTLKIQDFQTIKSYQKPPELIKITMEAICIMLGCSGKKLEKGKVDYWGDAQGLLRDPNKFIQRLENYEKDNISENLINKMKLFFSRNPQFRPEVVANASLAAKGLCLWTRAIYDYYFVYKEITPLRQDLDEANFQLKEANENLEAKQIQLQEVEQKCKDLENQKEKAEQDKIQLEKSKKECEEKQKRAQNLISSLSGKSAEQSGNGKEQKGEKERWMESRDKLIVFKENILGDILLSLGFIAYLGAFTSAFRRKIVFEDWIPLVKAQKIKYSENYNLIDVLGEAQEMQDWVMHGLPQDDVSKENAIIIRDSPNFPLMIDPQNQASNFFKQYLTRYSESSVIITKPNENLDIQIQTAIRQGKSIIIENCQEHLEAVIESAMSKENIHFEGGHKVIQIGNDLIQYNDDFRLYLICNLPRPHYTPEVLTKVTLLNFSITYEGLKDQMQSILTKEEDPKLQEEKVKLMLENSENNTKKFQIEEKILEILSNTEGDKMLEDDELTNYLNESKETSEHIELRQKDSEKTEEKIRKLYKDYKEVTEMASLVYFTVLQMRNLDYMYQFSLNLYITVFKKSIRRAQKASDKSEAVRTYKRVQNIIESLKRCIFQEVSRSVFVKHKLLFNFMLALTDLRRKKMINENHYRFLISGLSGQEIDQSLESPDSELLNNNQWKQVLELNNLEGFQGIAQSLIENWEIWKEYILGGFKLVQMPEQMQNNEKTISELQGLNTSQSQYQSMSQYQNLNVSQQQQSINQQQQQQQQQVQLEMLSQSALPSEFVSVGSGLRRLVFVNAIRPDLFMTKMKEFIRETLGDYFVKDQFISVKQSYEESTATTPLIFILSPGDDPQDEVKKLAAEKDNYLTFVSLGKGQGKYAEEQIWEAVETGQWVILQNCHLAISWLPRLEEIVENIVSLENKKDKYKKFNENFRLWLTTGSTEEFPISLLQNGVKMTKDPPKGIKANMVEMYSNMNSTKEDKLFFENCEKKQEWSRLFMALTFFHAIIRERRRYGPIGWNIYYDFNSSDFSISMKQLRSMLNNYSQIPFKALTYLTGQCYYGGKVTDDWDRRVLADILNDFYNSEVVIDQNYDFSGKGEFLIPQNEQIESLDLTINYIQENLPDYDPPEVFGLHENANISSALFEQQFALECLQKVGGGGISQSQDNSKTVQILEQILKGLPEQFDVQKVSEKYKITYYESMNTVLIQELLRYNSLLVVLKQSLQDLIDAQLGLKVMTSDLDSMFESIQNNRIPQLWLKKSYPSLKTLMGYNEDLLKRIQMFQDWIDFQMPNVFWISGFYFTQSFFTGVRQNYARKFKIPIDQIQFDFEIVDSKSEGDIFCQPNIGCYVNGLFMEGASWDYSKHHLEEGKPKKVYDEFPIIQLVPTDKPEGRKKIEENGLQVYTCPVYKTTERKGTLSTTGHSTNFILSIDIPSQTSGKHWTKRGVALISSLNI